jgi:hypothetical protein
LRFSNKKAPFPGLLTESQELGGVFVVLSDSNHVLCLGAFLTVRDCEFYFLTISQCFKSITFDSTEVNENVWAAFTLDEAKAFGFVKPLYGTGYCRHTFLPLIYSAAFMACSACCSLIAMLAVAALYSAYTGQGHSLLSLFHARAKAAGAITRQPKEDRGQYPLPCKALEVSDRRICAGVA